MRERVTDGRQPWPSPLPLIAVALLLASVAVGVRALAGRGDDGFRLAPGQSTSGAASGARATPAAAAPPVATTPTLPAGPVGGRVGLQIGHWRAEELPEELAALRNQPGGSAGGYREVDINREVARQVEALLSARGVTVDILPATVPVAYQADAFVAIHCDANNNSGMNGFKLARFHSSVIASRDDALLGAIEQRYGAATGQPLDPHLTNAMTGYYAFNGQAYRHAIVPTTPAVIVELGFLTNPRDRALLVGQTSTVAHGLADGILRFLLGTE